jgi:hypothetical protein
METFWDQSAFDEKATDWTTIKEETKLKLVKDFNSWKGKLVAIYKD